MLRLLVPLLLTITPCLAAGDKPGFSLVYDTKENSGIQINNCVEIAQDEITCDFKQISIFKKAMENELNQKVEEARQQFLSASGGKDNIVPKDCSEFEGVLSHLRGGTSNLTADAQTNLRRLNERERRDLEQSTALLVTFCKNPSEENAIKMARLAHQREVKTCRIYTSNYSQTFRRITTDSWASNEGPGGLCGVVTISRLERVSQGFWVYTTKRIVNNKRAPSSPAICKKLDESEHFFDWKGGGDRFVGCDYVEMSF